MKQISVVDAEKANKKKHTRREVFMQEIEQATPWKTFIKPVEPHYTVAERRRKTYTL